MSDFTVENHGTVWVFTAVTEAAKAEVGELGLEPWQRIEENSFGIDNRPASALAEQLAENGFTVSGVGAW